MQLHAIDIAIIVAYLITSVLVGYWVSHRASRDIKAYFLGGNTMPWYVLGISNASGMFDISGTMLLVSWMFVYGLKSVWIPWLWPTFNQVFLMVFLSKWLRRSNAMTGAEWIQTRFGKGRGAQLSHIIVVIYAFVSIIGFFCYGFKGIGKFAQQFLQDALPWHLSANQYALILIAITTIYVIKGGMFSVVITEVIQFCILSIASFAVGIIAMAKIAPGELQKLTPAGWDNIFWSSHIGTGASQLNWSAVMPAANGKIAEDGYGLFAIFVMMLLFKGIFISAAGPAPNYDMQRVLSSKNPREASLMSSWVNVVLTFPRYFLITGLTVLAVVFFSGAIRAQGTMDFEMVLPMALQKFVPVGLLGFLIAGLLAAFMSNFAATVNAAPPYFVNDIYKRYINPNANPKTYVRLSYLASLAVVIIGIGIGWYVGSVNSAVMWIVSGLWGGYTASNVLKWYWWRFNGYGYFWGMVIGIGGSLTMPALLPKLKFLHLESVNAHGMNLDVAVMFPVVFGISLIGCFLGTLLTKPEEDEILMSFYKRVKPWGFWGPVLAKVRAQDPSFQPNRDFFKDMFNVIVGVIWQIALVAFPIYIVIKHFRYAAIAGAVIVITSLTLKFTWYNPLRKEEQETAEVEKAAAVPVTAS